MLARSPLVSDNVLRIIPRNPAAVPSATARSHAQALLQRALPLADDVASRLTERVRFVDCGSNFESAHCPSCGADVGEWWTLAMEAAHDQDFRDLRATVPCCGVTTSLNDLVYSWPMGFARFTLEVLNPGVGSLPERLIERLETTLGCPIRVIWAHL
jgi:hypothetical protein